MSTNEARGFLDHILANPDDDAPRLVFADWLDEHGDSARAEFIRVQIERTQLPEWDARQVRLRLREKALLDQHGKKWRRELPAIWGGGRWETFRRGFMGAATFFSFAVFQKNVSACWAAAPIEAVSVHWPRRRDSLDNLAPIDGLRELSLVGLPMNYDEVERLAGSPLFSTLRTLNIRAAGLEAEGIRRLVTSPHLGNLKALRVGQNSTGNGGIRALVDAVSLHSLEELDLSEMDNYGRYGEDPIIDSDGVEALTNWPGMSRIRSLNLSGNAIGRRGLRTLLASPRAIGLKELILRDNGLNGSGMREFAQAPSELQLDVLNLGENFLEDEGAMALAKASCLRALKVLELDRCEIDTAGARRLAKAPFLRSLRRLNVNHNYFGADGLLALLEKQPPELHTLQIVANDLGNAGVTHLTDSPASDVLLHLNLAQNELKKKALRALMKTKHLRNLLILRLADNAISHADGVELEESPLGKRLALLEVNEDVDDDEETLS